MQNIWKVLSVLFPVLFSLFAIVSCGGGSSGGGGGSAPLILYDDFNVTKQKVTLSERDDGNGLVMLDVIECVPRILGLEDRRWRCLFAYPSRLHRFRNPHIEHTGQYHRNGDENDDRYNRRD